MQADQWWFPIGRKIDGRPLTPDRLSDEAHREAHHALPAGGTPSGIRPGELVWFYAGRPLNAAIGLGVVQAGYKSTVKREYRVVVAFHAKATKLLEVNRFNDLRNPPPVGRSPGFHKLHLDDRRRLTEWLHRARLL